MRLNLLHFLSTRLGGWLAAGVLGLALMVAPVGAQKLTPTAAQSANAAAQTTAPSTGKVTAKVTLPAIGLVTATAQGMWNQSRAQLVRIRIVPKGQTSQLSVGSGFFVSSDGLLISNFHVVSQVALKPDRYEALYETPSGDKGQLQLLGVDVVNDLSLLRIKGLAKPTEAMKFRPADKALQRGERVFSLGNPLDVGFAVVEGTYNGLVERSFTPRLFFSGAINGGMSGGPALDAQGRVVGINVAKRLDGEQVSFLVPPDYAQQLIERAQKAAPITGPMYAELTSQVLRYQQLLTDRFLTTPWKAQVNAGVSIPIPSDDFMRCWGQREQMESKALQFSRTDCRMDSGVHVGEGYMGVISAAVESYDGGKLGTTRFMERFTNSFQNESFASGIRPSTKPQCQQAALRSTDGLPMAVVLCFSAYKRFKGLYGVSVLVATQESSTTGTLGRLNASGVSFDNATKLARHFVDGFHWATPVAEVGK
jgi:serine protease Do